MIVLLDLIDVELLNSLKLLEAFYWSACCLPSLLFHALSLPCFIQI